MTRSRQPKTKKLQGQYTAPLVEVAGQRLDTETGDWILKLVCGHTVRKMSHGYEHYGETYCLCCSPEYKAWKAEVDSGGTR